MQLSQKQKNFYEFLAASWKSRLNFKHFGKKKMTLKDFVFWELRIAKT